jgi:outer membrane protein
MLKASAGIVGMSLAMALTAQRAAAQESPPPTRIAVVNVAEIFQNYTRAKEGNKEMEAALAPYKQALAKLQEEKTKLQDQVRDGKLDTEEKAAAVKKQISVQRQIEDLTAEAQKIGTKKTEQMMIDLYADVQAAIARHAEAQKFDLVLAYSEAPKLEQMTALNINRKLMAARNGGVVPMFIHPRIDITQAVLKSLNESWASRK